MSPSSSSSDATPSGGLFGGVLRRGGAPTAVSSAAWLRALLDVEGALALAQAEVGLLTPAEAEAVAAACADPATYDESALGAAAAGAGNPVVPLVRAIEARVGEPLGSAVHRGATSQDVLDTGAVLVARRALVEVLDDLRAAADAAAGLADRHRASATVGRTLLQHAAASTFGLTAAGWWHGLDGAAARLALVDAGLPVQLGGAVGTLDGMGGQGPEVRAALARRLGLVDAPLAWHTVRLPIADLAGALATAAGIIGKVALDVVLLAQTEVAEVREGVPGRGGSSAMPHKHNPVSAIAARAAALRAPGLASTLFSSMAQEHQRAAGAWHAEWETLSDLLSCTGTAAAWLRDCLASLQIDAARMAATLASSPAVGSDRVAAALAAPLGRSAAHDAVARVVAARGGMSLLDALAADPEVSAHLQRARLSALLDDAEARAGTAELVDRALRLRRPGMAGGSA